MELQSAQGQNPIAFTGAAASGGLRTWSKSAARSGVDVLRT
jgi:hypothetical protein